MPAPSQVSMRKFGDYGATRTAIYDNSLAAVQALPPVENSRYRLELGNVGYAGNPNFTTADHKQAMINGTSMARRITGTYKLIDKASGNVVDSKQTTVAAVPYLSNQGTFVVDGTTSALSHQTRLLPGVYARVRANGVAESHVNLLPGTGVPHRINLDPETGVFKMTVGQAEIPAVNLLKTLGATDDEMAAAWGRDLAAVNKKYDKPHYVEKLYEKFGPAGKRPDGLDVAAAVAERVSKYPLDPWVTQRTLGAPYERYGKDVLLATTKKLLDIAHGKAEPDDRDNPAYATVWGPEHLIPERLSRVGPVMSKILWQVTNSGSLKKLPAGVLTPAVRSVFTKSGLAQVPEGTSSLEFMDHGARLTKIGEGGIGKSAESIPDSARWVSSSQLPFIDPIRTSESDTIGVDLRTAFGTRLGSDKQIYAPLRDARSGKLVFKSPRDLADATVAFPDAHKSQDPVVPVIRAGKMTYAPKQEVDFIIPSMEQTFSPLTNLVPIKSASKPHRASMGARMITQSLPLVNVESPLVRTEVPNQPGKSFEELFGRHIGAVHHRPDGPGFVTEVGPDHIKVRGHDGVEQVHQIYNNLPAGRKSGLHQDVLVKPGDVVGPGQLLAKSNYVDKNGHAAYGANLRVAFMAMKGQVYEDSILLSQSAAENKLRSDHLYRHDLEPDDATTVGRAAHTSAFPGLHSLEKLKSVDDDGVVKPGTTVSKGDPLILAVKQKVGQYGRLSRSGKSGVADASEVWDHDEPGVVTDVHRTKNGPVVLVKSQKPAQPGDKVSGRHGNKGVINVLPDHEMPLDEQGRPVDMVISSLGTISRANPSAIFEAYLGKIAEKTGKPYVVPDFQHDQDVGKFVQGEGDKHGVKFLETLTDPKTGRPIPNVGVGNMYVMKLSHMASGKVKGRGLGGYDETGQPLRGQAGKAMRSSMGDSNALLSHGATSVIADAHNYKGQANDNFWVQYMSGYPAPRPVVSKAFDRFLTELKAAGIHPVRDGSRYHLKAMTDKTINEMAGDRVVENGETLDFSRNGEPYKGGLFSPDIFGSVDSGCFIHGTQIWTERGPMKIGDIVNNRLSVRVWSYNYATRQFVLKPVVNWFRNRSSIGVGASYYEVSPVLASAGGPERPRSLIGTHTHQVYQDDGSKVDLSDATHLVGASITPNDVQRSVIVGTLLGDAHITDGSALRFKHSSKQIEYLEFKRRLLSSLGVSDVYTAIERLNGVQYGYCTFSVHKNPEFVRMRKLWYASGVKRIPTEVWVDFNEVALAFWYLDDGCVEVRRSGTGLRVTFHTQGFDSDDVDELVRQLESRWAISSKKYLSRRTIDDRDAGYVIRVHGDNAQRLLSIVAPYTPASMTYKCGPTTSLLSHCIECNTPVGPRFTRCDGCVAKYHRTDTGRLRTEEYRRRRNAGTSSSTDVCADRHKVAGSAVDDLIKNAKSEVKLTPIQVHWEYGRPAYAALRTVYDIEVAETHNYVANGVLVSNSTWAKIPLHEPVLNPVFEEPTRRLLGLTEDKLRNVIAGKDSLPTGTGHKAIVDALRAYDVPKELAKARLAAASGRKTARDEAYRKLGYLKHMEATKGSPADWVVSSVPVLPPAFRPVTQGPSGVVVNDQNLMYRDLLEANSALKDLHGVVADTGAERLNVYDAVKAAFGLGAPVSAKNQERQVKGVLERLLGQTSKFSYVQQKLLGTPVDLSGRGQVLPSPDLDLDQIGIPESMAWDVYHPFVIRRLVRSGVPRVEAARMVTDKAERAKAAMIDEMGERPVLATRYPALHRYNTMAFHPKLMAGDAVQTNSLINKGYNLDHDGDTMTISVPLSEDAVKEAYAKLLPSKNLFSPATMKATSYLPNMEYVQGLHAASTMDENNERVTFKTKAEAISAYRAGKIGMGTRVRILEDDK